MAVVVTRQAFLGGPVPGTGHGGPGRPSRVGSGILDPSRCVPWLLVSPLSPGGNKIQKGPKGDPGAFPVNLCPNFFKSARRTGVSPPGGGGGGAPTTGPKGGYLTHEEYNTRASRRRGGRLLRKKDRHHLEQRGGQTKGFAHNHRDGGKKTLAG